VCIHRIAGPLCAATLTSGVVLTSPIGVPSAGADDCPDIEVVFARGTDEPPGVGSVGQAFINSLRSKVGGRSVGQYAVNYAATATFMRVADGVNDASDHVNFMVGNCPATRLVLGGYSQGAAVIDYLVGANPGSSLGKVLRIPGLNADPGAGFGVDSAPPPLSPEAADHVAAVAAFGNPADRLTGSMAGLPVYGGRTIDLCNAGDPICGPGDMSNRGAHNQYAGAQTDRAASFVAGLL
jgi:cutinase